MSKLPIHSLRLAAGLIFALSMPAAAERWVLLSSDMRADLYLDPASVNRAEQLSSITYLTNLKVRHVYASSINQAEFQCPKRLMRITSIQEYTGYMGNGDLKLHITKPTTWDSIVEKSVGDKLYQVACSVKSEGKASSISSGPIPDLETAGSRLAYLRWLGASSEKLKNQIQDWPQRRDFLQTVWYESHRQEVDTGVVLSLIGEVSRFKSFFIDKSGARGYMGVAPAWVQKLSDSDDVAILFATQNNLRYGTVLLRHYLDQSDGDMNKA
ncbi:MAG: surface-adhesin E family protein, partial [Limnobacter sp.]